MLSLLFALTLAAADAPPAAEPPMSKAEARAAAKAEKARLRAEAKAKVVCKDRVEPGTSMVRNVCITQAEWDKFERDFQNNRHTPLRPTTGMLR